MDRDGMEFFHACQTGCSACIGFHETILPAYWKTGIDGDYLFSGAEDFLPE